MGIRTRQGWLHLAILLDLFSRRVVGWSMNERPGLAPVLMALEQRQPQRGLIHHTDQRTIYAARAYRERMQERCLLPSMSAETTHTTMWWQRASSAT